MTNQYMYYRQDNPDTFSHDVVPLKNIFNVCVYFSNVWTTVAAKKSASNVAVPPDVSALT